MAVLDGISVGTDVQKLNNKELSALSNELREQVLAVTKKNGGHLSSNLGIIETTVALYKVFDFKKDRLLFDVGHQCYAHKILSGRKALFDSIRTDGGISGFPLRSESDYDAFIAGHAGNSIAAGLGLCEARDKLKQDYTVICVVGDASIMNGLNLEAMSVKGVKPTNFIVILNDNGMSISKNVNGFYQYLSKSTASKSYVGSKKLIKRIFGFSFVTRVLAKFRNFIKRLIGRANYFEEQGFKYVGVIDGNDVAELVKMLARVKIAAKEKAVLLHVKTTKGKGYTKAEERADVYHGVSAEEKNECEKFSTALGEKLCNLIEKDEKIIAITAGMKDGTGLNIVEENYPKNFVDVGIAEEYAVTSAAGMAVGGLKPVVAVYSTFLQRAYDQILHDVCMQNLPVVFCVDRAGVVGQDGMTHQGVYDLSFLLHIPNLTVFSPTTTNEFKDILEFSLSLNSPVVIRYPKCTSLSGKRLLIKDGAWEKVVNGKDVAIFAVGPRMLDVAQEVAKERNVSVFSARTIKPLPEELMGAIAEETIITLEENSVIGGFGSLVGSYYSKKSINKRIINLGIDDRFVEHGTVDKQLMDNGLTVKNVIKEIDEILTDRGVTDEKLD